MSKKLSKKERGETVTKGFLEEYLEYKNYPTKNWVMEMFEVYDKRANDRMQALMEDNQHKFEMLIEAFNSKFDIFDKRLIRVERKLDIV